MLCKPTRPLKREQLRLRKLIDGGNEYSADVVTIRADKLSVIIRETSQHPSLRNVVSFPTTSRTSVTNAETDPLNYDRVESPASEVEADSSEMIEFVVDAEQESTAVASLSDEIEDDAGSDAEDGVPMLDTELSPMNCPGSCVSKTRTENSEQFAIRVAQGGRRSPVRKSAQRLALGHPGRRRF